MKITTEKLESYLTEKEQRLNKIRALVEDERKNIRPFHDPRVKIPTDHIKSLEDMFSFFNAVDSFIKEGEDYEELKNRFTTLLNGFNQVKTDIKKLHDDAFNMNQEYHKEHPEEYISI